MTSPLKTVLLGLLAVLWTKPPVAAETTAELLYYPSTAPAEAGGEGYLLIISTIASLSPENPTAEIRLACSATDADVTFSLLGDAVKALPIVASDPEKPGELHAVRFEAGSYVAKIKMDWVRWSENEIEGAFISGDDLFAFEKAVISETALRAEAFDRRYTFDMGPVIQEITDYLQGCSNLLQTTG